MKLHSKQRYRRILSRIVETRTASAPSNDEPAARADWEEQAAELHDRYVTAVDEEIRYEIRQAARRALDRLDRGDFGFCIDCGQEISPQRLAAVPWTERCVRCQALHEQGAGRRPAPVAYFAGLEKDAA
jgi:RNA polymerase-binding transcription factor DksA